MDKKELPFLSAAELSRLIESKQVSPVEATEQGARYKLAADALIDVLVELHSAARWREWELRTAPESRTMPDPRLRPRACSGGGGRRDARSRGPFPPVCLVFGRDRVERVQRGS